MTYQPGTVITNHARLVCPACGWTVRAQDPGPEQMRVHLVLRHRGRHARRVRRAVWTSIQDVAN